ncbi:MAG: glutamate synthase (NADPH), homotetrameric [Candidatus Nanohalarchaeota archaeon]|nr:MAG: glutamate synthase (NADPH), homotetrameric [Candidatus Nanohaloarchaeota archaeon]
MSANKVKRVPMPELAVEERVKTFDEVPLGYTEEQAVLEAGRCMQCGNAPCIMECPVNIDIKMFLKQVSLKDFKGAFLTIKKYNPIPAITGRVCPQETQCEGVCTLGKIGDATNIGKVESFVADWARKNNVREEFDVVERSQKVAVIGSGPASISCAVDLRKSGYQVVMYEALHKAGGVLQYGIPEFRLPRDVVDAELSYLSDIGVEIRLNRIIGQNVSFDELRDEYDAIFVGTGAGAPLFLGIDGEKLNGVYSANEFLIRVNLMKAYKFPEYDTPVRVGGKVGVIGAGNVAMDAARSAVRLGAEVHVLYRRTKKEAPVRVEEMRHAIEEGINFVELVGPVRILGEEGWVKGIELVKMKLGKPDKSGRPRPVPVRGSEFTMDLDTVVVALGTRPNRLFLSRVPGLETTDKGIIIVGDDLATNIDGVFAGGDAISGGSTVILALGEGRKAAKSIEDYLAG